MDRLPDATSIDDLEIRRWTLDDVPALHAAIVANVEHLRARMPWIGFEPVTLEGRRELVEGWTEAWELGGDVHLGIWRDGTVVGATGLHHRGWPDGPEIGFWVAGNEQGKGIATRASAALTTLALTDGEVGAVYLAHDRTNLASRRVPEKLGYRWIGEAPVTDPTKIAPADCGVNGRWRMARADWTTDGWRQRS